MGGWELARQPSKTFSATTRCRGDQVWPVVPLEWRTLCRLCLPRTLPHGPHRYLPVPTFLSTMEALPMGTWVSARVTSTTDCVTPLSPVYSPSLCKPRRTFPVSSARGKGQAHHCCPGASTAAQGQLQALPVHTAPSCSILSHPIPGWTVRGRRPPPDGIAYFSARTPIYWVAMSSCDSE